MRRSFHLAEAVIYWQKGALTESGGEGMPLLIIREDITRMEVDAIVSAGSAWKQKPNPVGGEEGSIHRKAGLRLLEALRRLGGIRTGAATLTRAYNLRCRYVIHTAGPVWRGGHYGEALLLRSCYLESLKLAAKHDLESIAFPLISTGTYGYPKAEAMQIASEVIREFLQEHDMTVYLVVYDRESFAVSNALFTGVQQFIDQHYVDERQLNRMRNSTTHRAYEKLLYCEVPDLGELLQSVPEERIRAEMLRLQEQKAIRDQIKRECDLPEQVEVELPCMPPEELLFCEQMPIHDVAEREAERVEQTEAELQRGPLWVDDGRTPEEPLRSTGPIRHPAGRMGGIRFGSRLNKRDTNDPPELAPLCQPKPAEKPASQPEAVWSAEKIEKMRKELERALEQLDESFGQMLLRLIDEKGISDPECYHRANVDRKLFNKIKNTPGYKPKKPTAVAFCIALQLDMEQTRALLSRAGYGMSRSNKFDVIIEYFITQGFYDVHAINQILWHHDQLLLGSG